MRFYFKTDERPQTPQKRKVVQPNSNRPTVCRREFFIVYPIRVVYRIDDSESAPPRFFINIPKRNFKRAVKRVYLRRRIREAYRLNKQILTEPLSRQSRTAHLAFLYLDKNLNDFHFIEKKVIEILERLARKIESQQTPS